jgi:hypothetical protein
LDDGRSVRRLSVVGRVDHLPKLAQLTNGIAGVSSNAIGSITTPIAAWWVTNNSTAGTRDVDRAPGRYRLVISLSKRAMAVLDDGTVPGYISDLHRRSVKSPATANAAPAKPS